MREHKFRTVISMSGRVLCLFRVPTSHIVIEIPIPNKSKRILNLLPMLLINRSGLQPKRFHQMLSMFNFPFCIKPSFCSRSHIFGGAAGTVNKGERHLPKLIKGCISYPAVGDCWVIPALPSLFFFLNILPRLS